MSALERLEAAVVDLAAEYIPDPEVDKRLFRVVTVLRGLIEGVEP